MSLHGRFRFDQLRKNYIEYMRASFSFIIIHSDQHMDACPKIISLRSQMSNSWWGKRKSHKHLESSFGIREYPSTSTKPCINSGSNNIMFLLHNYSQ